MITLRFHSQYLRLGTNQKVRHSAIGESFTIYYQGLILYIILAVFFSFMAFGLYQANKLTHIEITKQVTIDGSQQEVFDMVKYLNNYPKWSPFLEADPAQKYELKGKDGEVGVQFHWDGNGGKEVVFNI